jgi:uncharacterized protein YkwD
MFLLPILNVSLMIVAVCCTIPDPIVPEPTASNQTVEMQTNNESAYDLVEREDAHMVQSILASHNDERARQGQSALIWDAKLARDAQAYAQILADKDIFEHAAQPVGNGAQGENLWMGSKAAYDWRDMVGMWIDEGTNTKSGAFPNVAKSGDWSDVGHYTQIIWPETAKLGCGLSANRKDEYLVCRYFPAGNVMGKFIKVKTRN